MITGALTVFTLTNANKGTSAVVEHVPGNNNTEVSHGIRNSLAVAQVLQLIQCHSHPRKLDNYPHARLRATRRQTGPTCTVGVGLDVSWQVWAEALCCPASPGGTVAERRARGVIRARSRGCPSRGAAGGPGRPLGSLSSSGAQALSSLRGEEAGGGLGHRESLVSGVFRFQIRASQGK